MFKLMTQKHTKKYKQRVIQCTNSLATPIVGAPTGNPKILEYWIYSGAWKFVNNLELSTYLPKYDLKHLQIFTQVLKVDKENPGK